jgi:hypothetical protein
MINNWDEVQAITNLTFIIQEETGLGLARSMSIAERLWKEGYCKHTQRTGFWYRDTGIEHYRCSECNSLGDPTTHYCKHCGSCNIQ